MQTPGRAELLSMLAKLDQTGFEFVASLIFAYQAENCPIFGQFLDMVGNSKKNRPSLNLARPTFLPISFFKTHSVQSGAWEPQIEFTSSGTTGQTPSRHRVRNTAFYLENTVRGFRQFYGDPSEWAILALLPSYLERSGSSLVAMADHFIRRSNCSASGFFLDDYDRLESALVYCRDNAQKTMLLGVSFALLDFAERNPMNLQGFTVMETGGMKGRRKELTRADLHATLRNAFSLAEIHSEYGMTELFSQAYATGGARFYPAPTMRVLATELNDPFCPVPIGRTGVLNIIDLANIDTCSFIQTEDLGRVFDNGSFEVLGRADAAEIRGCNLMVE